MNNLPLLRILSADSTAPALDAPGNPDAPGAEGAFGSSLAEFLRGDGGELPAVSVIARGGDALPDGGKHLPPASGEGLRFRALPREPADPAAVDQGAGLPAGPAAVPPVQAPGQPAVQISGQVATAPPRTGNPHTGLPDGVDGEAGPEPGAAMPNRGILPGPGVAGTDGGPRFAERPAASDNNPVARSTQSGERYAAPASAVRLQTDVAIQSSTGDVVEGLAGKALTGQSAGFATLSAHGSPAPLSTAAAAQPATAGPAMPPPAATPVAMPAIDVVPGADGWGDALGERVIMMAGQRLQSADIRLNPAELGPLRVQVSVDDGTVSVNFHAQHAVTRDAIEQALPRLRDLLGDNGLALGDASVSDQGAPREDADHGREPAPYGSAPGDESPFTGVTEALPVTARRLSASSLVDLFA